MSFDLDAALGLPFTFTFDGNEYTLPVDIDWTTSNLLADGKVREAISALLGEEQWDRITSGAKPFGTRAYTAILTEYNRHLGFGDPGESPASSGLSENTAGPSRPTSNASTGSRSPGSVTVLTG